MSIGPLKRRSSWPSSFLTGLIGWIGFFIIVGAALGNARQASGLLILATAAAVVQVLLLRLLFFPLRIHRSILASAFWGGLTGAVLVLIERRFTNLFEIHPIIWVLDGAYIGIAVGLFLCYFYRDDRRIEEEAKDQERKVDYGRDAHWLEPFFFGAVAYLVAFVPTSPDLAANVLVLGAMSGVVAAGVSHFFLFSVSRNSFVPVFLSIIAGAVQGALTGLLFRTFATELLLSPITHGAIAGSLTYLMTALRGRVLARKEMVANS